jgi:putative ABC transport system permease protein
MKPKQSPPKLFVRLFRWFCRPKLHKYIEGDLIESYAENVQALGKARADLNFIIEVIQLFRPGIVRPMHVSRNLNQMDMLSNYLKVGVRNILRHKVYSAINIFGLATGMAAGLLISLYVVDEINYDKFIEGSERMYRIGSSGRFEGDVFQSAVSSAPVAEAMLREIPEVEEATRFWWLEPMPMRREDNSFIEKHLLVADSNFFQFFSFPLLSGDAETVLKGANKVVITQSTARRFFGSENAVGKILLRGLDRIATEVTGIAKDPPSNSHIKFDMILSGESVEAMKTDQWSNTFLYSYIKANPTAKADAMQQKLNVMAEKNLEPELKQIMDISMEQFKANGNQFSFFLQPLHDIHLSKADLSSEMTPGGNILYVYVFAAVAIFILTIACINFMNLATARSATRAKEIGVRKSIGAFTTKLIGQFLTESMIYSTISTLLAFAIIGMALRPFSGLAGKSLTLDVLLRPSGIICVVLFTIFAGLIAGSYPAFFLSKFKPVDVLKGRIGSTGNSGLRNVLVVFQFMISICLVIGTLVVYKQLKFMQDQNMGFDKENVIVVHNGWSVERKATEFMNDLLLYPHFKSASFTSGLPPYITDSNLFRKGGTDQDIVLHVVVADYDHMSTMGYSLAKGRTFSRDLASDSISIILNETAYRKLGFTSLDGQTVINFNARTPVPFNLIGVVKDFNFENLRTSVKPIAIVLNAGRNNEMVKQSNNDIAIRIRPGNMGETVEQLQQIWKKYSSGPFEFTFLDENINATFRSEQRMGQIIFLFAALTIFIACLGLFGLAAYLGEQRGKEISIRKVLGASVNQVIIVLLKDFTSLIGIAFVIAAPIGWYIMSRWLEGFAYRTKIDLWVVFFAGSIALAIAFITIGYQSIKVASENPIKNLKNE